MHGQIRCYVPASDCAVMLWPYKQVVVQVGEGSRP
jgi:hypothetical protein